MSGYTMRHALTRTTCLLMIALATTLAFTGTAWAAKDDNRGTIKIHDGATADPDERNEPHVSCDFYVQGFNMKDAQGHLEFFSWPPTGDKSGITPSGDTLTWTGTADGDGEWNFQKGAYFLPEGHYRLEAYTDDGHPGNESHFAKAKMFWVDPCDEGGCTENCTPPPPPCVEGQDEGCTEVPFFPTPAAMALGIVGTLGAVGAIMLRRRG